MTKWRDTVLRDMAINEAYVNGVLPKRTRDIVALRRRNIAKAQAEITGDIAYQQGMREVVEWLENNCMLSVLDKSRFTYKDVGSITFQLGNLKDSEEWQTKCKEWGI